VQPAGTGAPLQVGDQCASVPEAGRRERDGVEHDERGQKVWHPGAKLDHERLKPAGELLAHRAALRALYGAEVLVEQQDLSVVGGEEKRNRQRRGPDHDCEIARLEQWRESGH
jgi:hypothetical protein